MISESTVNVDRWYNTTTHMFPCAIIASLCCISPNDIRLSLSMSCSQNVLKRNSASAGAMPVFERRSDAEGEDEAARVVAMRGEADATNADAMTRNS